MSEFEIDNFGMEREIKSNNILCDSETGRVVAVFYNDYDLRKIQDLQDEVARLKAKYECGK